MEKEYFTIYPFQGFGLLRFGLSVEAVKKYADVYGGIETEGPLFDEETWRRTEKQFKKMGISDLDIENTKKLYHEVRGKQYRLSLKKNIILFFEKNKLFEVRLFKCDLPAYLGKKDIFLLYGESAARFLAEYLQENPYMNEDIMFFIKHCMAVIGYFSDVKNGKVYWTGPNMEPDKRGFILNMEGENHYGFDPETTLIYKFIK